MSFDGQVLTIGDTDNFTSILSQIDPALIIVGSGSPVGAVAALKPTWYADETNNNLYFCYQADGTILGTNWIPVVFDVIDATTLDAGIIKLATAAEVTAGTANDAAITPLAASTTLAAQGTNADITELTGITTPLTVAQGGTGVASIAAILAELLPTLVSGAFLSNDGTSLNWRSPVSDQVLIISTNSTLAIDTFHLVTANSLTLLLPSTAVGNKLVLGFQAGLTAGPSIGTSGDLIMGIAGPLICDITDVSFEMEYLGSSGWWITAST